MGASLCDTKYDQLKAYRGIVRLSSLISQIRDSYRDVPGFSAIRCLALGSPTASHSALFQLALLVELESTYKVKTVSVYDPVFSITDRALFEKLHYEVRETFEHAPAECLFFLPHADLELTEEVLVRHEPHWLLANNIFHHTERMLRYRLHEKFHTISLLLERIERSQATNRKDKPVDEDTKTLEDGFIAVPARRKRGRKQTVHAPPPIEFNFDKCYYESAAVIPLNDEGPNREWENAFSSLGMHSIMPKTGGNTAVVTSSPTLQDGESLCEILELRLSLN